MEARTDAPIEHLPTRTASAVCDLKPLDAAKAADAAVAAAEVVRLSLEPRGTDLAGAEEDADESRACERV